MPPLGEQCHAERGENVGGWFEGLTYVGPRVWGGGGSLEAGGEAKTLIKLGYVKVNGEIEIRRGRKLNIGDKVMFLKNELIFE